MGRAVEAGSDLAVLTNDNPRTEEPQVILRDLLSGLDRPAAARVVPDRAEAIAWALSQARPGDCVLVAGKGHESYQVLGTERIPFDDCEVARTWLYANQPEAVPAGRLYE
jgi:UDP-N-acetylmuramoyl-L-alanyl-D-glutamate--2,6-diaminopimelate ligase